MGCQFDGKCRDNCSKCTDEKIGDKLAKLIDEVRDRVKELSMTGNIVTVRKA